MRFFVCACILLDRYSNETGKQQNMQYNWLRQLQCTCVLSNYSIPFSPRRSVRGQNREGGPELDTANMATCSGQGCQCLVISSTDSVSTFIRRYQIVCILHVVFFLDSQEVV